jgi:hypothetical protein
LGEPPALPPYHAREVGDARRVSALMQTVFYLISAVLGIFGLLFLVGSAQGNTALRIIFGLVMLGAAAALIWLAKVKTPGQTIIQNIDMPGDTEQQQIKCQNCGGTIGPKDVSVVTGAIYVKCPYCGTSYQLEEAPKW